MTRALPIATVTLLLASAGCGPPTLFDTDLRPVREPAFLVSVPYGWAAVDNAARHPRVIVELSLEADRVGPGTRWPVPALECPAGHLHRADRVRREGPFCLPALHRGRCHESDGCGPGFRQGERCTYLVRAEYRLDVPAREGDTLTLVADRWRAPRALRRR